MFALYLCLGLLRQTESQHNLTRLYRYLLTDYERDVRPSLKHDVPVNITFLFSLIQIIDVDERNQIMTTSAWIRQTWIDYRLTWDPELFENITMIHIPYEQIWRPDIILYNNADSHYKESLLSTDVLLTYVGNVTWAAAAIFKSSCALDVRYYPFDKQDCLLKFASWAYDGTKIDILILSEKGDETNFMPSTEWELTLIRKKKSAVIYSCCPEPYPYVDVLVSIQRRPMFYVFNLILPCVMISAIALLGFYLPSDSGEKVTLGITSLLSTTVFLMLVAEGMPPTSEALPLIGLYYGATIFIVSLATAMTVLTLNVHHQGEHGRSVPPILQYIAFKCLARILFLRIEKYHSISNHAHYFYERERSEFCNCSSMVSRAAAVHCSTSPSGLLLTQTRSKLCNGSVKEKEVPFLNEQIPLNANSDFDFAPDDFESEFLRVLDRLHAVIARNEVRLAEKDRRKAATLEWQQVALVLDRFLLLVFLVGTALFSFGILYQRHFIFE